VLYCVLLCDIGSARLNNQEKGLLFGVIGLSEERQRQREREGETEREIESETERQTEQSYTHTLHAKVVRDRETERQK